MSAIDVHGTCTQRFAEVRTEFARNFDERGEVGASVCLIHNGECVVDLWGGSRDQQRTSPWMSDTLVVVFSSTKGAVALCAHILASAGELDLDAPVRRYWRQFAQAGKAEITTRLLLNHQAGLPGVSDPLPPGAIYDFDAMARLMERQAPLWAPGSRYGYHALTFGWLVGEVIKRVSGEPVGQFFRRRVAEPLGLDFWIGLPLSQHARVAPTIGIAASTRAGAFDQALAAGDPIAVASNNARCGYFDPGVCDEPAAYLAEIPAANGVTNARGLARMYAPLAALSDADGALVDAVQLEQMGRTESAAMADAVYGEPGRHSAGFEKSPPGRTAVLQHAGLLLAEPAFGHSGRGGSVGFADPHARLAFGYAMNRHPAAEETENDRRQPLIDAAYRAVGYTNTTSGKWRRAHKGPKPHPT